MQGHNRQLYPEGDQQPAVTEQLEAGAEVFGSQFGIFKAGGAAAGKGHGQGHQQDEQGAAGRIEDEFGGCVLAFFSAPDGQQQVHRQQFQLPCQEEQQHVLHGEYGDLAAVHGQQQEIKQPWFHRHGPGRQGRQGGDETGEQDQRHGEAIGPHRPAQAQLRQPGHPLVEL